MSASTQWNPNHIGWMDRPTERDETYQRNIPVTEHKMIRHTSYMEVANLLKTSGCSKDEPYWDWTVLGVVETNKGILVLSPGDWFNEFDDGSVSVSKEPVFKAEGRKKLRLSKDPLLTQEQIVDIMLLVDKGDREAIRDHLLKLSRD
jgi:hypothetical protein